MLKTEFRRAFYSKSFLLAWGIALVMLAIGGVDYIFVTVSLDSLDPWLDKYLISLVFGMTCVLGLFYPIVAMIPYGLCYRRERDSGYRQLILLKTTKKAYLRAKILAVSCSAFVSMLVPNLCWILVCRFMLGKGDPKYSFRYMIHFALPLYDNHPFWFAIMYAVHAAVLGAVFAVLGLGVSAVVRNRYLALLLPFAFCVFSSSVLASYNRGFAAFDLLYIQLYEYRPLGYWIIPIYETALLTVGLVLFLGGDHYAGKA